MKTTPIIVIIVLIALALPICYGFLTTTPDPRVNATTTKYWTGVGQNQHMIIDTKYSLIKIDIVGKLSFREVFINVSRLNNISITQPKGVVYDYYNISGSINFSDVAKTTYFFQINKNWTDENHINHSSLTIHSYNGSQWVPLSTIISEKDSFIEANAETIAPSLLALTGIALNVSTVNTTQVAQSTDNKETQAPAQEISNQTSNATTQSVTITPKKLRWWIWVASVVLLVILVSYFLFRKRGKD